MDFTNDRQSDHKNSLDGDGFGDEFEFKPLTEGLGFHRKAEKPANTSSSEYVEAKQTRLNPDRFSDSAAQRATTKSKTRNDDDGISLRSDVDDSNFGRETSYSRGSKSISDLIASLPPSLDFVGDEESPRPLAPKSIAAASPAEPAPTRPQIFQPLARAEYKVDAKPDFKSSMAKAILPQKPILPVVPNMNKPPTAPALPVPTVGAAPASPYRERLDESFARAFPRTETSHETRTEAKKAGRKAVAIEGYTPVPVHFGAVVLDAMVVTGMSTFLMVCIVLITHVNLWGLMTNAQTDGSTQVHLALLFIAVMNLYLLTARSFFTCSLGEWAFDLQVGTDADQKRLIFPLQVGARTLALTFSGLIVLPVLSQLFNRDLLEPVTGLQLYHKT